MDWAERALGGPAANTVLPEFSPNLFYCDLHEQPDHLVPEYALALAEVGGELVVHPRCLLTRGSELPPELLGKESLVESFALQGSVAWVPHPAAGGLQPFLLNDQLAKRLRSSDFVFSELPQNVQKALLMAGILIRSDAEEERPNWSKLLDEAAGRFKQYGYAPVAGLIHPFHVSALRRYFRHRIRTGGMTLGDGQSSRRYVAHNESVARFFHHQLAPVVTAVAGEEVKPSYVYAASYQGGAKLERHTDREQCEFSITFCLDYSPEPWLATGWPLQLHTPAGTVTVYQAIGDALLYRGRELPHSRPTLSHEHTSTSIFFHYVREGFAGSLD